MVERINRPEKSEDDLTKKPLPPLPIERHAKIPQEKKGRWKESISTAEAAEIIAQMEKQQNEINLKMDEIFEKTGWTPRHLKKFLNDPSNFDDKEWEFIKSERKRLYEAFNLKEGLLEEDPKLKPKKAKSAGNRRNWIPMK